MSTAVDRHVDIRSGTDRVLDQLGMDTKLGPTELVSILTHCAAVTASADYRLLQAASLLFEDYTLTHETRVAAALGDEPAPSVAGLFVQACTAARTRARFGPDGMEQAIGAVGSALNAPAARARELIIAGATMRHQLPLTGRMLARGRIDLARFLLIVNRTTLCEEAIFPELDAALAEEIEHRAPMSSARFRTLVDASIARIDAASAVRRLEEADRSRHIRVRPDRHTPGQSRITGSLPAHRAAGVDARLNAMAQAVHPADPRSIAQRRADALVALTDGHRELACICPDCTASSAAAASTPVAASTPAADASHQLATPPNRDNVATSPGTAGRPEVPTPSTRPGDPDSPGALRPRPTFHIIVSLATLLGANDCPAFLDGHGILDAAVARDLVREAKRSYAHTTGGPPTSAAPGGDAAPSDRPASGYAPSRSLRGLVAAGELCCTFPGCTTAVSACDLDHTISYADGGRTRRDNLKPLCRFHHRLKTFDIGWRDYQDPLGTVAFRAPTGHYFIGNAYTGYDLFTELRPPAPRRHPARGDLDRARRDRIDAHTRARDRWERAHPPPF
ncbi:HNH endonuclease signature motif containing protein [Millisia brevis]|uniref:HNH endonuclease signature motif containing protein n=1 Tax=Millisia brevis TaxID=264148 RepID=UPI00082AC355|nr:HNH endonuclease signature motif containing protein [Millisia brevis]